MSLEQRLAPAIQTAYGVHGPDISYASIDAALSPGYTERVKEAIGIIPVSFRQKRDMLKNLDKLAGVAYALDSYLRSDEGSYVMDLYGISRDDIAAGGAVLPKQALAATIQRFYPLLVLENRDDDGSNARAVTSRYRLSTTAIRNHAFRHELRHHTQQYQGKVTGHEAIDAPLIEADNSLGLAREYGLELPYVDDKREKAALIKLSLEHFAVNYAVLGTALGTNCSAKQAYLAALSQIGSQLSKKDQATLYEGTTLQGRHSMSLEGLVAADDYARAA